MLLSSFLVFVFPADQPEATYSIDFGRLKTCGIYAESTIFGSVSFFSPLSSPKLQFNDTLASFMQFNSKRMNVRWSFHASNCLHCMQLSLANLLCHFHALNAPPLPAAASSQCFKPFRQPLALCGKSEGGIHSIQDQESECIAKTHAEALCPLRSDPYFFQPSSSLNISA